MSSRPAATELINRFDLEPHPEGGHYRETYRALTVLPGFHEAGFPQARAHSTAIYFLLEPGNFSAFHRIRSDELWHFYEGSPLHIFVLDENGDLETITLGRDIHAGQLYQAMVPAGCWFASRPATSGGYAFVGCTVAPGFDFRDFEMATPALAGIYPQHKDLILSLVR